MRHVVIISKRWDHPKISMILTDEELSFAMDLMDFVSAIKMEMALDNGNCGKLDKAVENVIKGIKGESARIM